MKDKKDEEVIKEEEDDDFCDLDPLKICDNCGKCIKMDDWGVIKIDKIEK